MQTEAAAVRAVAAARSATRRLTLADGRSLAWLECGDPSGSPLLHFHGTGFCRFEVLSGHAVAKVLNVRLIAFDRPGFGRSSPMIGDALLNVARDAIALMDSLEIERFGVSGFSGGFPHALATAGVAPARVASAVAINTAGDASHPSWRALPRTTRLLLSVASRPIFARWLWPLMFADMRKAIKYNPTPGIVSLFEAGFAEGSRNGDIAAIRELDLFYRLGWRRVWSTVKTDVLFVHGAKDGMLPFVRSLAEAEKARIATIPGDHCDWATDETWSTVMNAYSLEPTPLHTRPNNGSN